MTKAASKNTDCAGGLPKDKREALIESAAAHAAARARKEMIAILSTKEVARRTLRRGDVQVTANVPKLGRLRGRGQPPWIGDWDSGDEFTIIDDDPTDAIIHAGPNGPIWWMDMDDPTDPE